jgi:hypothetical protein
VAEQNNVTGRFKLDLEDASPLLVQVLIQAISPTPAHCLPKVLYTIKQGPDDESITTQDVHWNMRSCLQMRELAVELGCTVVIDMVTEQISRLIFDRLQAAKSHSLRENEDFGITLGYLASLDAEDDAAFIRFVQVCHRLPHSDALEKTLENDRRFRELHV